MIDLPAEEGRAAVARLLRPGTVEPYSTHVLLAGAEARDAAVRLERRVLGAGGIRPPRADDLLVVVVDVAATSVAGVLRLGRPDPDAPAAELARALRQERVDVEADELWELASVAVHPAHRAVNGGAVALALYQGLAGLLDRCAVRWLVARLDVAVLRLLTWYLAGIFEPVPGSEGGQRPPAEVLPVWCDVRRWRARLAEADPAMAGLLFDGRGLDGIVRPADWAAVGPRLG